MQDWALLGMGRLIIPIPPAIWQRQVSGEAEHTQSHLGFMSADHHRVRDFAVTELPRAGQPLAPEVIARELDLPLDRVQTILGELERHLTFLFRNAAGAVVWAYPVTAEPTPHRVTFSSGERLYAA